MLNFFLQLFSGFITAVGFSILYNVPANLLLYTGIVGGVGFITHYSLATYGHVNSFVSMTVASFLIGMLSQLFARKLRTPVIIFTIPGIIPLVPGAAAYNMMRLFIEGHANTGISYATETLLIGGALALGLALNSAFFQLITTRDFLKKGRRFFP
ncbi:threonine/serine exporter family protein [Allofustis seminis]|uniref:threonine/serine exporter family protein n=1 Tax=Allofustis seminis TaxID=166939 RepID=UPI00037AD0FA|nr:threonine/serine exporter family protein [Allofustis seminis]